MSNVKDILKSGDSVRVIKARLTLEGLKDKEINELVKDAGLTRKVSGFFHGSFIPSIIAGEMTKEMLAEMVLTESDNVQKHLSHYESIRSTVEEAVKNRK